MCVQVGIRLEMGDGGCEEMFFTSPVDVYNLCVHACFAIVFEFNGVF